jgi:hypothetical protein
MAYLERHPMGDRGRIFNQVDWIFAMKPHDLAARVAACLQGKEKVFTGDGSSFDSHQFDTWQSRILIPLIKKLSRKLLLDVPEWVHARMDYYLSLNRRNITIREK